MALGILAALVAAWLGYVMGHARGRRHGWCLAKRFPLIRDPSVLDA